MAVKVLIKRSVPQDKAKTLIPLVRQMRASAATQTGYITGETLRSLDKSEDRNKVQSKIDDLLGGETEYEIFHYGFSE
jgi:hypothetical protein